MADQVGDDPHIDSSELTSRLGVELSPSILRLALTHRSFAYEHGGLPTNERLEFLGDSVLGIVVTDTLYRDYAESPEGQLARMRAAIVNSNRLPMLLERSVLGSSSFSVAANKRRVGRTSPRSSPTRWRLSSGRSTSIGACLRRLTSSIDSSTRSSSAHQNLARALIGSRACRN